MGNMKIDDFKTYEDYKDMFIAEKYVRHVDVDTVLFASDDNMEVMGYMDEHDLWDDCMMYYVDDKGNAMYPDF